MGIYGGMIDLKVGASAFIKMSKVPPQSMPKEPRLMPQRADRLSQQGPFPRFENASIYRRGEVRYTFVPKFAGDTTIGIYAEELTHRKRLQHRRAELSRFFRMLRKKLDFSEKLFQLVRPYFAFNQNHIQPERKPIRWVV